MPKVLISDELSEAAIAIFKSRGVEVDFQPSERVALIRGQVTHLERHAGAVHRVVRARPRDG